MESILKPKEKPTFIIVTADYSGLGWGILAIKAGFPVIMAWKRKEGDDEDNREFALIGKKLVPRMTLEDLMKARGKFKNAYWVWDGNHNYEENEQLRKEGFKVLGGSELAYKMENDRAFGTSLVEKAGLATPPTSEFSTIEEGLTFLEQNPDKAYVFKPDAAGDSFLTYVPDSAKDEDAHQELVSYMQSLDSEGTYILQERKKGIETNFEVWVYKGKPFFAFCCLESKRKSNKDKGEMVGCAHDIAFAVKLESKGIKDTVIKLLNLPEFKDYTGFLDMNIIVCNKENYFLEFCARFGYNAHPNLFVNLAIRTFPEIIADFMDGKINNFYDNFKYGFGASIGLRIEHPKKGFPLYLRDDVKSDFFHYDSYVDDQGQLRLSGYSKEVGIVCGHDYTIKTAAEEVLHNVDKINYPLKDCRTDIDKNDYPSSPQARFDALEAMDYFDK